MIPRNTPEPGDPELDQADGCLETRDDQIRQLGGRAHSPPVRVVGAQGRRRDFVVQPAPQTISRLRVRPANLLVVVALVVVVVVVVAVVVVAAAAAAAVVAAVAAALVVVLVMVTVLLFFVCCRCVGCCCCCCF